VKIVLFTWLTSKRTRKRGDENRSKRVGENRTLWTKGGRSYERGGQGQPRTSGTKNSKKRTSVLTLTSNRRGGRYSRYPEKPDKRGVDGESTGLTVIYPLKLLTWAKYQSPQNWERRGGGSFGIQNEKTCSYLCVNRIQFLHRGVPFENTTTVALGGKTFWGGGSKEEALTLTHMLLKKKGKVSPRNKHLGNVKNRKKGGPMVFSEANKSGELL